MGPVCVYTDEEVVVPLASRIPKRLAGIKLAKTPISPTITPSTTSSRDGRAKRTRSPENLTHTAQNDLSESQLAEEPVARGPELGGVSEDELFGKAIRPREIEGLEDWGIPEEVDPGEASCELTVSLT